MSFGSSTKSIIVADTNVAYILYFFLSSKVVPEKDIVINQSETLYFHPIVLDEVTAHEKTWMEFKALGRKGSTFPHFFDSIQTEGIEAIKKFVKENMSSEISSVDIRSGKFFAKRKIYESERKRIQDEWQKMGTKGNKVTSKPSDKDYSLLYTAETSSQKIATNDEILLSVAQEFLPADSTYKAEDVIRGLIAKDPSKREAVESASQILIHFKLPLSLTRALE